MGEIKGMLVKQKEINGAGGFSNNLRASFLKFLHKNKSVRSI